MTEPSGVRVWVPVSAGIFLWLVHLITLSSLSRSACVDGTNWLAHVVTSVTALLTIAAMVACEGLRRRGVRAAHARDDAADDDAELMRNLEFLGLFGIIIGAFSLALILYEGSWAITVPACHP